MKIVDPATGQSLSRQRSRANCAPAAMCVMLGYYNNPEATREAIDADGWLHTGDMAVRLTNGYYKITGRIKDMVIRGGENIYPREIEEFLFTHPAVEQASVVGVPDPKYGEELCAWIKLKPGAAATTEEEIRQFCRSEAGTLQSAALREIRECISANGDRQNSKIQNPRTDVPRSWFERAANRLKILLAFEPRKSSRVHCFGWKIPVAYQMPSVPSRMS